MPTEIKIPEVGESITEAFINEWFKSEGDRVEKDEIIAELETDKVSFELPAPVAGTLTKVLKSKGDTAQVGEVIGHLEEGGGGAASKAAPKKEQAKAAEKPPEPKPESKPEPKAEEPSRAQPAAASDQGDGGGGVGVEMEPRVMPGVQQALDEHGLRVEDVKATGPGGRLVHEDVMRHVEGKRESAGAKESGGTGGDIKPISARMAAQAASDGEDREQEIVTMSPIRQTIGRRLVQAQQTAALLTTFNEVDLSAVQQLRRDYKERFEKRYGVKLGFMSFFIKAAVDALKAFPAINAEVREKQIVYRNYYDIGVAVSTDKGLVVPVLRNADQLSFSEIESAINDFARRARDNQLELDDIRGGTFTITNGGVFGSLLSTPIVNPPQSGVLGMHTIQDRPVARDGQVVIRPMMYLALTYDHRIVDGRDAVTFLGRIKEAVEEPARLLMEV